MAISSAYGGNLKPLYSRSFIVDLCPILFLLTQDIWKNADNGYKSYIEVKMINFAFFSYTSPKLRSTNQGPEIGSFRAAQIRFDKLFIKADFTNSAATVLRALIGRDKAIL